MKKWMTALMVAVMTAFFANTAYAAGWVLNQTGWWFATKDDGSAWLSDGWYWLDGNEDGIAECYYFDAEGYMLANTLTPDGYTVDADGAWTEMGQKQARPASEVPSYIEEEPQEEEPAGRVVDPTKPMVALTFDDGPYAKVGNQIMDCLAKYDAKVTFFVVGDRCASYQTEMKRMADEGHEIATHTYEHKYLDKLDAAQIREQIDKGVEAIVKYSGVTPALVRLPGGRKNDTVLANVAYPMIQWNIDTRDWETKNTEKTVRAVLDNVKDGDIVLMHELYASTGDAVEQIVPELIARGYQLVTVSEMAQARGVQLQAGQLYYSFRP